jgi:outer membrane protein W
VKVNNYYADLTFYSGKDYRGFRPLVGVTLNKSGVTSQVESGSSLLSTLPEKSSVFEARPYAGIRYDLNDWLGLETRVTQSKDFGTVGQVRASVKKEVFKNVSIDLTGGFDKSKNYTAAVGMVGLKINF